MYLSLKNNTIFNKVNAFFKDFDIRGSAMSLRQKIDSFNMTKNLTNQRKEAEKASGVNVQFTSLDVKLVLKRKIYLNV